MKHWDRRLGGFCAIAGVVLLLVAASLYLVERKATSGSSSFVLAGIALLVAYGILDPTALTGVFRARRPRARSLGLLVTGLVLGILVGANLIAARETQAWDLTREGLNTLNPQSVVAAKRLSSDLQVIGLFRSEAGNGQTDAEALVSLYQGQSQYVKYRRENVDTDVADVKRYDVLVPNTLVLDYRGKTEALTPGSQAEQNFTSAVLKLESDHVPVVCWVTGDGERDLKQTNQSFGYSGVAALLAKNNFATNDLLLGQATAIPTVCDEVALVVPSQPLPSRSVTVLDDYLAGGGKLLIVAEPWQDVAVTRSLSSVLKPYGLAFSGALVIEADTSRAGGDPTVPAVFEYGSSPITKDIKRLVSFFPQTTAITGAPAAATTAVVIGTTSGSSYAIGGPRQDLSRQAKDAAGPFTVMETLEQPAGSSKTRIVIVGTGGFAENRTLPPINTGANLELGLSTFQWLAEQDALISMPSKANRALPLALGRQDQSLLIFVTAVVMPGLMVVGGVAVWWRRRQIVD